MPSRAQLASTVLIGFALVAGACSERVSRSETTNVPELIGEAGECVERFSANPSPWGESDVRASFVYDVTGLGEDANRAFLGRDPAKAGAHRIVIAMDGGDRAIEGFLSSPGDGDTAFFQSYDLLLFRVNDGPAPHADVLRTGCARLRGGVAIRQVTFSQGQT